jgi:hypothetical protein
VPFCLSQDPYGLTKARTQAFAEKGWRLKAGTMALVLTVFDFLSEVAVAIATDAIILIGHVSGQLTLCCQLFSW